MQMSSRRNAQICIFGLNFHLFYKVDDHEVDIEEQVGFSNEEEGPEIARKKKTVSYLRVKAIEFFDRIYLKLS